MPVTHERWLVALSLIVAIHGAYWHNLFGSGVRISHGCINMRVADAAWLYEWAPLNTSVQVHY